MYDTRSYREVVKTKKKPIQLGILLILTFFILKSCFWGSNDPSANQIAKHDAYKSVFKISDNPLDFSVVNTILKEREACRQGNFQQLRSIEDLKIERNNLGKAIAMRVDHSETSTIPRWNFVTLDREAKSYYEKLDEIITAQSASEEEKNASRLLSDNIYTQICQLSNEDSSYTSAEIKYYEFVESINFINNPEEKLPLHKRLEIEALKYVHQEMFRFKIFQEGRIKYNSYGLNKIEGKQSPGREAIASIGILIKSFDDPNVFENVMKAELNTLQIQLLMQEARKSFKGKEQDEVLALIQKNPKATPPKTSDGQDKLKNAQKNINENLEFYQQGIHDLQPDIDSFYRYYLLLDSWLETYDAWLNSPFDTTLQDTLKRKYALIEKWNKLYIYDNNNKTRPPIESFNETAQMYTKDTLAKKLKDYFEFFNQSSFDLLDFKSDPAITQERQACATNQTKGLRSLTVFRKQKIDLDRILGFELNTSENMNFYGIDEAAIAYRDELKKLLDEEDENPMFLCTLSQSNSKYTKFEDEFYALILFIQNKRLQDNWRSLEQTLAIEAFQEMESEMLALKRQLELRLPVETNTDDSIKNISFKIIDSLIRSAKQPNLTLEAIRLDKLAEEKTKLQHLNSYEKKYITQGMVPPEWSEQQVAEWNRSSSEREEKMERVASSNSSSSYYYEYREELEKFSHLLNNFYITYARSFHNPNNQGDLFRLTDQYKTIREWIQKDFRIEYNNDPDDQNWPF